MPREPRYWTKVFIPLTILVLYASRGISAVGIACAALGDSYAAGIGSTDTRAYGPVCYQSDKSYVSQLGKLDNVTIDATKFLNRTCAGLGLFETGQCEIAGNVTADPENDFSCRDLSPSDGIANPDLVTISMGAESIEYYRLVSNCVYFPSFGGCAEVNKSTEDALAELASPDTADFLDFFNTVLKPQGTLAQNPSKIKVINYPLPFNTDDGSDVFCPTFAGNHISLPDRKLINSAVQRLDDNLRTQAEAAGATYVDTNAAFDGHRFCDNNTNSEWLNNPLPQFDPSTNSSLKSADDVVKKFGVITQYPDTRVPGGSYLFGAFHPTADGHQAIAQLISQNMR